MQRHHRFRHAFSQRNVVPEAKTNFRIIFLVLAPTLPRPVCSLKNNVTSLGATGEHGSAYEFPRRRGDSACGTPLTPTLSSEKATAAPPDHSHGEEQNDTDDASGYNGPIVPRLQWFMQWSIQWLVQWLIQ